MEVKQLKDYYETIYNLFPEVNKKDIFKILNYGWKQLYMINNSGGFVCIQGNVLWTYIGPMTKDPLRHFEQYALKLSIKIRILYKKNKIPWDGYYYFALTDKQYQDYLNQKNPKGRKRKNFKFYNIFMYRILEECKIKEHALKYIFRIPYIINVGYMLYKKELKTDQAELIITREPLKFKDILVTNNKYDIL